jgi:hypothetical protein
MPRPDKGEKRRIEQRRAKNEKARDEAVARDAAVRKRVEGLLDQALNRAKAEPNRPPDRLELIARLEEHRQLALSCWPPQIGPANSAVFMTARLLGYVVDQQAIVHADAGTVDLTGNTAALTEQAMEKLRERIGSARADRLLAFLKDEGVVKGNVIDIEPDAT